ncbi:MAG: hypothetical protein ACTHZY_12705, partial [Halomonas sp.]|uniref:hypothetical protein n=1 Tax=Halomonas sp. AOP42-E1-30 TaxID=3457665 RepID=UPI003FB8EAFF
GGAVGKRIGVHTRGGIERGAHAAAQLAVPLALGRDPRILGDPLSAISCMASLIDSLSLILAGSSLGPTMTKSLYITLRRSVA